MAIKLERVEGGVGLVREGGKVMEGGGVSLQCTPQ